MVLKVKSRTFHLPLPMEETLKKICPSNEPINLNHELYILVRGIPTKANIIWEKLVDVKQFLFYSLHDTNMRQLNAGIFHKLNVTDPREKYTAATYLEQLSNQQLESNLSTIFSKLRNTEQYWRIPRGNLRCMINNYGPATWFLTLSPCEWLWTDLIEYLREINGSIDNQNSANELIAFDPVSTLRFIDNKFKAMLDFICSPDNPIGEVTHYFWRREYQGRGMQYFHLLIWIKDAPVIGTSSNEEIASFILKYVTCRMPNKEISPELHRRVNTHQRHKHNDYCLRTKKTKVGFSKVSKIRNKYFEN
ncbi:hypothetical protein X777_12328 [Ooceraea biroi]|uniref:Helitron helicase-like domain-containing protein n=1 Tax=Ooceraea biroi TaxID=2015173 RepID=A0A026W0H6_OOCBI|nr:hypothetical protein X777_12328 [Ooceraea biroi]